MHNKRLNIRTHYKTWACIKPVGEGSQVGIDTGEVCVCGTKDISLKGLFCADPSAVYPVGTICEIKLSLGGEPSAFSLKMQGRVVRSESTGMAIEFNEMDIESLIHLKNIMYYNTGMPEIIDEELIHHSKDK